MIDLIKECGLANGIIALAGVVLGVFIGDRLAIRRDRRNEFNALVEPVHDLVYRRGMPDDLTISKISNRFFLRRVCFSRAVEAYQKSQSEENRNTYVPGIGLPNGGVYKDPNLVERSVKRLLKYLEPR